MASDIMGFVKFQDGSFASLLKEGATLSGTADELQTGGVGLNQVSGVSIGQAYSGKVAIAAHIVCIKDGTSTAPSSGDGFSYGYFLGPDGKIICLVQGGGGSSSGLSPLSKPVRMQTGVDTWFSQAAASLPQMGSISRVRDLLLGWHFRCVQGNRSRCNASFHDQQGRRVFGSGSCRKENREGIRDLQCDEGTQRGWGRSRGILPRISRGTIEDDVPLHARATLRTLFLGFPLTGTTVLQNDTLKVTATT